MKRVASVLAVFLACSGSVFAQSEAEIRDRIVGTWKLVSEEETMEDGTTRPYQLEGPNGKGFLIYARDGYMCANLVNPNRAKWVDSEQPTKEEKIAAADGSFAYCGRYEIDVKHKQIVHLPEVATDTGFAGTRQVRPYNFENRRLVFSDVETHKPGVIRWKIAWEKVR
jgi:Lipocalin-like domain